MGRDWHSWSRSLRSTRRREEEEEQVRQRPPGCMSGMLHLLQFRQLLLFPSHQPHHGRHQRRPPDLATMTRDPSLKGFRGVRAKSSPINDHELGRGTHHNFATLLAGAKRDSSDSSASSIRLAGKSGAETAVLVSTAPSSEMKKEATWLEDVVGSFQGETPRTSNVVARLMGLDELPAARPDYTPRRFHPSPAQVITQQPSSPKPRHHDQKENNNGKQQRRQEKGGCGREDRSLPLAPLPERRPLSTRNYNVILEMEGSRSLPGTPRMSCSGRRSCDSETPRLSLQLDTPVMEEFDFLCEVVPERQQSRSASRKPYSRSLSLTDHRSANKKPARLPQQLRDDRSARAAGSGSAQQNQKVSGAGKSTGGGTCRSTGHENKKIHRSPPSTCCSELNSTENTPETKRVVAEAVAVPMVNIAVEHYPNPVPLISSPPLLENRVAEGKKMSRTSTKPSTERYSEKRRRPHPEKATGRSRSASTSRSLTVQSKIQLPSPKPAPPWPSPPPRSPPAVRHPAVRPPEELRKEKPVSCQISPSLHGSSDRGRGRSSSSSRRHRPDEDDEAYRSHPEFRYVRMILECVGLLSRTPGDGGRPPALARWHSPSHPIDPTVFYRLELFLPDEEEELRQLGRLRHRCNRKLLFHLVEEILADILRRSLVAKPRWRSRYQAAGDMTAVVVMERKDGGDALLRQLWSCIRRIRPAGQFRDMRDIDAVLAGMGSTDGDAVGRLNPQHRGMGEEVESIAAVVEEGIFGSLVEELKV